MSDDRLLSALRRLGEQELPLSVDRKIRGRLETSWTGRTRHAARSPFSFRRFAPVLAALVLVIGVGGSALGGPLEVVAALVGEMLGMEQAPIEFVDNGRLHSVKVGNAVDIEIEDFVPPGSPTGDVSMLTGMAVPFNSTLTIAKANRSRTNAFGLSFANVGQNGHSAPFSWAA